VKKHIPIERKSVIEEIVTYIACMYTRWKEWDAGN
jgi:hypothetical protein